MITKEFYVNGWSHFIDCINFNSSGFDSETIVFMNEIPKQIMDLFDNRDAMLDALKAVWCDLDGTCPENISSETFDKLKAAIAMTDKEE